MPAHHAVVENSGDGIYLRAIDSGKGTQVNGVLVRDAVLHTDDQIAFERNRFVLEAPSLPTGQYYVVVRGTNSPEKPSTYSMNNYNIRVYGVQSSGESCVAKKDGGV